MFIFNLTGFPVNNHHSAVFSSFGGMLGDQIEG
jgi:hypothetical protein